jgi:hypothetical protein
LYTFQGPKIIGGGRGWESQTSVPLQVFGKQLKLKEKRNINTKNYFSNLFFYPVYYRAINKKS